MKYDEFAEAQRMIRAEVEEEFQRAFDNVLEDAADMGLDDATLQVVRARLGFDIPPYEADDDE